MKNPELVFKGFSDLGKAQAAYKAAKTSGVIDALQKGEGQKFWVVMEGFKPGVYFSGCVSKLIVFFQHNIYLLYL